MPKTTEENLGKAALRWVEGQLRTRPDDPGLWYSKGVLLAKEGELEKALIALKKVLWLDSDHVKALEAKGKALFRLGSYLEAFDVFRELTRKVPRDEEYWYYCGESLVKLEKREKAKTYYDKALQINPGYVDALYGRGDASRTGIERGDVETRMEKKKGNAQPVDMTRKARQGPKRVEARALPTSIDLLDLDLGGGVSPGSVVLITGMPGTFKTSLCFWILFQQALRRRAKGLFITVEQSKESLRKHLASLGLDPSKAADNLQVLDLARIRRDLHTDRETSDWFDFLKGKIEQSHATGVRVLALDSLEGLESLVDFEDRRAELHRLFDYLRSLEITSFITAERYELDYEGHPIKVYDVPEYLSDGVIELNWRRRDGGDLQRALRVAKMRDRKHSTSLYFLYWENGFKLSRALTAPPP